MSNTRRDFISLVGAAALTGTAASRLEALASAPASRPGHPRRHDWDMSWTSKLDKRYRVVLDAPENAEGDPILRAHVWLAQYQEVFGVQAADTSRVLVLRHNAIVMAMKDDFWGRFKIGDETGFKDAAGKGLLVNDTERGHIRYFSVTENGGLSGGEVWADVPGDDSGVVDG